MLINNIEHGVVLFVSNADKTFHSNFVFNEFLEFNEFIIKNKDNTEYEEKNFAYSFSEMIEGKSFGVFYQEKMEFEPFTQEQIEEAITGYIELLKELEESRVDVTNWQAQFRYLPENERSELKKAHLKDIVYVCPTCINELEDCHCEFYHDFLIQIDRLILPVIRELNKKGYRTTGCCAGHPDRQDYMNIYVRFEKAFNFSEPFPDGSKYSKLSNMLFYEASKEECENIEAFQKNALDKLIDWAKILTENIDEETIFGNIEEE